MTEIVEVTSGVLLDVYGLSSTSVDVTENLIQVDSDYVNSVDITVNNTEILDVYTSGPLGDVNPNNPFLFLDAPYAPNGFNGVPMGFTGLALGWSEALYVNHKLTEVWRSTVDDISTASMYTTTGGSGVITVVDFNTEYYHWIRFVSYANVIGPWHDTSGLLVVSSGSPANMLSILEGQITESKLHGDLTTKIARVGDVESDLNSEVQNRTIAILNEIANRTNAIDTAIVQEVSDREASISQWAAAEVDDRNAVVATESVARINADGALALDITTLNTTVGDRSASVQTIAESLDGVSAQYTVKVDSNGRVGGYGIAANPVNIDDPDQGTIIDFQVVADRFSVWDPTSNQFVIGTSNNNFFVKGVVTVQPGSNVAVGADVTQTALNGSTTMGAGTLHLSGTDANIAIGAATTWGSDGIQLQYNSNNSSTANPRAFIGSSGNYVKYEAGNLTIAANSIGAGAAIGAGSVAFGSSADASGPNSIAIGVDSEASYVSGGSVAIGNTARALGISGTSIGEDAYSEGSNCSAIGRDSKARGRESVALGTGADAGNEYAGRNNQGSYATAIGAFSEATAGSSTAVGAGAKANFTSSTAIGIGAETTQNSQIMLGTTSNTISALGSVYLSSYLRWNTGELFIGPLVSQSSTYDAFYSAGTFQTAAGSSQGSYEPYDNPFPTSGRSRGFRIEGTGSFRIACTIQKLYSSSATGYVRFLVDNVLVYEASISYQGSAAVTLNLTGMTYGSSLIIQSRITGNSNTFYVNNLKISSNSQMFYMRGA
jgi:hypothetical protein